MHTDLALVSVIIPSHNRKANLRQTLEALARQACPAGQFEVLVVLDGCTDGSMEMLGDYAAPFSLRVIDQAQAGSAAARNRGASGAKGELLIFLDDDIEACPGFIQAHETAHLDTDALVGIGYTPPTVARENTYMGLKLRLWWEAKFQALRQPGARFCYTDLLSGNFSIRRDNFFDHGGFNPVLPAREDYELGARLIHAGLAFSFLEAAHGMHQEQPDLGRALQRKFMEAVGDVRLGQMYPELIPTLAIWRLTYKSRLPGQVLRRLIFHIPWLATALMSIIRSALAVFEKARLLILWRWLFSGLLGYWYWKGVLHELPDWKAVNEFLATRPDDGQSSEQAELALDLALGLDQAEQTLNRLRPNSVAIFYGDKSIGYMPAEPGTERWRGAHLRPFLVDHCLFHLMEAFASQGILDLPMSMNEIAAFLKKDAPYLPRWQQENS
jgi:glycosyltransferase involved in cell wall biosynthesis